MCVGEKFTPKGRESDPHYPKAERGTAKNDSDAIPKMRVTYSQR